MASFNFGSFWFVSIKAFSALKESNNGLFSNIVYLPCRYLMITFQLFFPSYHCLDSPGFFWALLGALLGFVDHNINFSSVFFSFFSLLFFCCFYDDLFQRFHFPIYIFFANSCLFINLYVAWFCYDLIEINHHVFHVIHICVGICFYFLVD